MEGFFGEISPGLVLALIIGMVEFAKKLGVSGNGNLVLSMGVGVALGVIYQLQAMYPEISPWVVLSFYGLLMGLAASGLYDLGKRLTKHD